MGVQVENYVVGAPCGVMDQMASSLGDQQALMAMSCQPAEVEPEVPIPSHLKFWGLDSGVSCSLCPSVRPSVCLSVCVWPSDDLPAYLPAWLPVCLSALIRC